MRIDRDGSVRHLEYLCALEAKCSAHLKRVQGSATDEPQYGDPMAAKQLGYLADSYESIRRRGSTYTTLAGIKRTPHHKELADSNGVEFEDFCYN